MSPFLRDFSRKGFNFEGIQFSRDLSLKELKCLKGFTSKGFIMKGSLLTALLLDDLLHGFHIWYDWKAPNLLFLILCMGLHNNAVSSQAFLESH